MIRTDTEREGHRRITLFLCVTDSPLIAPSLRCQHQLYCISPFPFLTVTSVLLFTHRPEQGISLCSTAAIDAVVPDHPLKSATSDPLYCPEDRPSIDSHDLQLFRHGYTSLTPCKPLVNNRSLAEVPSHRHSHSCNHVFIIRPDWIRMGRPFYCDVKLWSLDCGVEQDATAIYFGIEVPGLLPAPVTLLTVSEGDDLGRLTKRV